jgi:hypothetical protein
MNRRIKIEKGRRLLERIKRIRKKKVNHRGPKKI